MTGIGRFAVNGAATISGHAIRPLFTTRLTERV